MKKILVVEDDEKIAMLERDYLESSGYEAVLLEDGGKVISELKRNHYDLVLLDIMLPGRSGYEICRQIRSEIDIPILMVTARTESVDVIRGLGLGADDYITKPFDPSQLVARVRTHLRRYDRLTGREEKETQGDGKIRVGDVVIEPKTWKVWKKEKRSAFLTGSLSCCGFWRRTPILYFQKKSCLKKYGGMIMSLTQPRCLSILTACGKKLRTMPGIPEL